MLINKIIVGVSGGPDSIYLLDKLSKKQKFEPIAVHVNYHFRDEANDEQKYVEEFCKQRNIKLYVVDVKDEDWIPYKYLGNKQSMARELRYDKYFEYAKLENTKYVHIAHHKDDFIETAIMQSNKSEDYLFFGIKDENRFKEFRVQRPLLNLWKKDIISSLENDDIKYMIDKSNFEPVYERNKIRIELSTKSVEEKEEIYNKFVKLNEDKKDLRERSESQYNKFVDSDFSWESFMSIDKDVRRYVVYLFLINSEKRINISSHKLDAIVDFIENKRGDKKYRLMEKVNLCVKNSKIIIMW